MQTHGLLITIVATHELDLIDAQIFRVGSDTADTERNGTQQNPAKTQDSISVSSNL